MLLPSTFVTVAAEAASKVSLQELRFSPNGQYILAQDESSITVLTVQPFAVLFRVPAEKVTPAQFTPDSRQIVFVSSSTRVDAGKLVFSSTAPRVEKWSIADQARVDSRNVEWRACGTQELSPDGRTLACVDSNGVLRLIDVASATTILTKPFSKLIAVFGLKGNEFPVTLIGDPGNAYMDFSPDGRFILAYPPDADGTTVAWDLRERRAIQLSGGLRSLRSGWHFFAFVAPDRILMSPTQLRRPSVNATLLEFPSGRILLKPKLPPGPLFRAGDPGFILIRPFGQYTRQDLESPRRAAAVEFSTGQVITSETPALDVFGKYYVAERTNGEIGLYERGTGLKASISLQAH